MIEQDEFEAEELGLTQYFLICTLDTEQDERWFDACSVFSDSKDNAWRYLKDCVTEEQLKVADVCTP